MATFFFEENLELIPLTLDPSAWWAPASWVPLVALALVTLYAFRIATVPEAEVR